MTGNPACLGILGLLLAGPVVAQEHVSFPAQDGWIIHADLYGTGTRGVVGDETDAVSGVA